MNKTSELNKTDYSNICINKCLNSNLRVDLTPQEQSYHDRCIYKILDTMEFGNKFFKYFEYKINE